MLGKNLMVMLMKQHKPREHIGRFLLFHVYCSVCVHPHQSHEAGHQLSENVMGSCR